MVSPEFGVYRDLKLTAPVVIHSQNRAEEIAIAQRLADSLKRYIAEQSA